MFGRRFATKSTIEHPRTEIELRLDELREGRNPRTVARVASGWVELAPFQHRRGYVLLLADPVWPSLNDAPREAQLAFLADMARVGDAVREAVGAVRCNYSIYGNLDPFLHAHIVPRFADEPDNERTTPPMSLPLAVREDPRHAFDPARDAELIARLRAAIESNDGP